MPRQVWARVYCPDRAPEVMLFDHAVGAQKSGNEERRTTRAVLPRGRPPEIRET